MRKVVVHRAGGYEQLKIETQPDPRPGPDEVAITVEAIGVNYADCVVRMGLYASAKKYVGWPITPGFEVAGTDDAGRKVLAVTRFGGYATHVVVPSHQVFPLPSRFSVEDGAGFPGVFLTAYYALFELAHPRAGQKLLVHSAAGGVGGALIQLGKIAGCEVVGVVGAPHKVPVAKHLGADHVIDKSREDLWRAAERYAPGGYDVVLDANGVSTLGESFKHLRSPGKLVIYGFHSMLPRQGGKPRYAKLAADWLRTPRFNPLDLTNQNKSVMAFNMSYLFEERSFLTEAMGRLIGWIDDGKIVPPPLQTFPLDRVADAHRAIESGQTVGKLVLIP